MTRKTLFLAIATVASALSISLPADAGKPGRASVAVVIDQDCYSQTKDAVNEYVDAMELDGKTGILLIDEWGVPDSIRVRLETLHREKALEGAVLIGDIPVPMIRDAQHLSSAFKMDQKRDWKESSIPSDRYYDDFHLQFNFLSRDKDRKDFFYYSLAPESPQQIRSDIYTARIKPAQGQDKYKAIADFLRKAVRTKKAAIEAAGRGTDGLALAEPDRVMFFAGHGYNSESMVSRMNEYKALHEQIPSVNKPGGKVDFINFDFDKSVKTRLLSALGDEDLDVALLHHHGYNDMQLLNGSPYESTPDGWLALARNYFREKMRSSRNPEATRKDFIKRFGIPGEWLDEASDPELIIKDSLYDRSMDIYTDDIDRYDIKARFVLFDACFNGAFTEADYVVPHYLFGEANNTVAALAHSVNTLQDVWTDELVGLFDEGVCAGNIFKHVWSLENHLFGDPTFHFGAVSDLDRKVSMKEEKAGIWRKLLKSESTPCDVKCLAVRVLTRNGNITGEELLDLQRNSGSGIVRLAAFNGNIELAGNCLTEAISLGLDDSYELLQRLSARYAGYNQSPELDGQIVRLYVDPLTPTRVMFQLKAPLVDIETGKATELVRKYGHWKGDEGLDSLIDYLEVCGKSLSADLANLESDSPNARNARLFIRSQRNQCRADILDALQTFFAKTDDPAIKLQIAELLGWYRYSYAREKALGICRSLHSAESDPVIRDEFRRSISRLGE
ncbi:MAG: hypothetical protein SPH10_06850 [Candidatus Cryptobacteroides sp.]|nr:hypothetical protein [Candidatus Cryptobacteroides sp.]